MPSDAALSGERDHSAERTYRCERWRAVGSGVLETAGSTFLLLIAVQHFQAGALAKALVAGGGSVGLAISPLVVSVVARWRWPAAQAAAVLATLGGGCFLVMAAWPHAAVFVLGSILAMAASSAGIPLMTQVYQDNYPAHERGHLFARTFMLRIGTAALFSEFAGQMLSQNMGSYRALLVVFAAAFFLAATCLACCPSQPLTRTGGTHPLRALRFVKEDPLFRRTLVCWMLMGFANLMMLPLRVEYLGNPRYGMAFTAGEIAFLTGVVPNAARLVMSPVWGWLFDRMNFFALRATLNLGFALGILAFFTSADVSGLILGALVFGVSNAGGDVAWSLWVTKFSAPEHVADYMSVHTFFTGLRGVVAPLCAFYLLRYFGVTTLGWLAAALIVAASVLLIPEFANQRTAPSAEPIVDEASD